jgi:arylamine N-acetyltransferase
MMNSTQRDTYLAILQAQLEPPTFDHLRTLVNLHLNRIPFENVSKLHYYMHRSRTGLQWLPDTDMYLNDVTEKGLGGNCYILNAHFVDLLRALDYRVDIVRATGGNTHLALMVTVEGHSYYVDVGYGAPLFEPLSLDEEPRFSRCGEEVEIRKLGGGHYLIDRRANGQSFVAKTIERMPVSLVSFDEAITHSLRDEDENPFMRRIVATLFKQGIGYSVINHKLFVKSGSGTEVHEFTRKRDWLDMMRGTFRMEPEPLEGALDFLAARGVKLF